ncbi:M55 family metallopeptidase [Desulfurococcus mucosus]|uniref:D-aminopeptidase DppA n=1 Tax=Desulfurococcus mucosus (strain ATCC 35584 / DSM 2162 / JCM 9187 / O7/1) TaxID=765177 RepID=E8R954_DESM0|nr:M55 family metallopeptidase [Desulfurococcus mucosus]ADV65030.1 D-aminopeptidase DppA [Desulfurococcus mucosus DSM 2162]
MKAYISVDLEGLPGVSSLTMLNPGNTQFNRPVRVLTKLLNTVVDELSNHGFETIYVADSHGLMTNIDYLELDSRAELIQGYPRPFSMVTLLDSSFDAALFIGYHSAAGTIHGILDHTMSGRTFAEIKVNGEKASEFIINSLYAGEQDVPVILLAGDEHLGGEVEKHSPWTVFVPLKKGLSRYSAIYPGIDKVTEALREGVAKAVKKLKKGEMQPLKWEKPYRVELNLRDSLIADILEALPVFKRVDAYRVEFSATTAREMLGYIELVAHVGYGIDALKNSIK